MDRSDTRRPRNADVPAWIELSRAGFDVYRDRVNAPSFFALLPSVGALFGPDLGFWEGHNNRLLAGADVVAIDVAESFIEAAASENRRGGPTDGTSA